MNLDNRVKVLLLKNQKTDGSELTYHLVVMRLERYLDWKLLRHHLKKNNLNFCNSSDSIKLMGCFQTAVPPFGSLFNIQTVFDTSVDNEEKARLGDELKYINFSCGLRTHTVVMKYADFFKLEKPRIQFISKSKTELDFQKSKEKAEKEKAEKEKDKDKKENK